MTPLKRKIVHAGLVALAGALTDAGAQLASGTLNLTRAVVVGVIVGVIARAVGAALAAAALDEPGDKA